ncbi:TRADD-N-associated membrane domain-containing protein [Coleofasciculus sp. E1-EBD-02]|uniref:TRADD-N-associated membrane domain-containing protein n=1 Tax=Coleofasciculus sp. E1-EBD-02 TaxID=3068481 RepID=UPI0032F7F6C0
MNDQLQTNTKPQLQGTVTIAPTNNSGVVSNTNSSVDLEVISDDTAVIASLNDSANSISRQWYQERAREAKASFNLAISLATATAVFGIIAAGSLCIGNVSATVATTAAGIVSGSVSGIAFKLYEKTSQSLDDAARELLD